MPRMSNLLLVRLMLMLAAIHPRAPMTNSALDVAIASNTVVDADNPAFGSPEMDVAVLLVTAWEESRFKVDAVGDGGDSLGAWELQRTPAVVAFDLAQSTPLAYAKLRESARQCPDAPLAPYIGGCYRRRARVRSAMRMALARIVAAAASLVTQ